MTDDFDSFKADDGDEPPDGVHTAYLEHTAVLSTKNGRRIKFEWRTTDLLYYWESWHGVSGGGKGPTKKSLAALAIDLDTIKDWDELGDELAAVEGKAYLVEVEHTERGFLNVSVEGPDDGGAPPTDIPADDFGLPEPSAAPVGTAGLFDDDDVPF